MILYIQVDQAIYGDHLYAGNTRIATIDHVERVRGRGKSNRVFWVYTDGKTSALDGMERTERARIERLSQCAEPSCGAMADYYGPDMREISADNVYLCNEHAVPAAHENENEESDDAIS